jgi:hypothetical protein
MTHDEVLAYYSEPGVFTTAGAFADQVEALPDDIGAIAHAVQMLLVHRWWAPIYNVDLTPEREEENGLHGTEAMLAKAMQLDPAPIGALRLPDKRVVGICRHFSTMMAAFLKRKGIPARARCGFAAYFEPGRHVDHWVTEYWNAAESRWVLVDAQLDSLQREAVKADFDPLDVPRDRFLVAGDVWQQYRASKIAGEVCGIADMWGACTSSATMRWISRHYRRSNCCPGSHSGCWASPAGRRRPRRPLASKKPLSIAPPRSRSWRTPPQLRSCVLWPRRTSVWCLQGRRLKQPSLRTRPESARARTRCRCVSPMPPRPEITLR